MAFQGTFETFYLADVFQNLSQNHQTGTLHLKREDGEERHLYFQDGKLMYLSKGRGVGLLRDGMYVARGVCTPTELQQSQEMSKNSSKTLGECLVSLGTADSDKVGEVARYYVEEETYELFNWPSSTTFEFVETPPEEGMFDDLRAANYPPIEVANLIMEAAHRIDEWERLLQSIDSMKEVFIFEDALKEAAMRGEFDLTDSERRVMQTMNAGRDLEDIVQITCLSPYEIGTAAAGFVQAGMARKATVDELKQAVKEAEMVGDKGRCIKLYERILSLNSEDAAIRRKLADMLPEVNRSDEALVHLGVLGDTAFSARRDPEAIETYKRVIELDEQNIIAHTRLIDLMNRTQQDETAGEYAFKLAGILASKDRIEEAIQACEKAVETDIRNIEYRAELVNLLLQVNEKGRAARELEMIGDVLHKQGKNRAAADTYKRAMTLDRNLTHLKGKLQNVLLSEDEKRRRKTRLVLTVSSVLLLVGLGVAAVIYYLQKQKNFDEEYTRLRKNLSPLRIRKDELQHEIEALGAEKIQEISTRPSLDATASTNLDRAVIEESTKIIAQWNEIKKMRDDLMKEYDEYCRKIGPLNDDFKILKDRIKQDPLHAGYTVLGGIEDDLKWFEDTPKELNDALSLLNQRMKSRVREYYDRMLEVPSGKESAFKKKLYATIVKNVSTNLGHRQDAERSLKRIEEKAREDKENFRWLETHEGKAYWSEITGGLQQIDREVIKKTVDRLRTDNKRKIDLYEKYWDGRESIHITMGFVVDSDVVGGTVFLDRRAEGSVGPLLEGQGLLIRYDPMVQHELTSKYPDSNPVSSPSKKINSDKFTLFLFDDYITIAPQYEPVWTRSLEARPLTPLYKIDDIFYVGVKGGAVLCIDPQSTRTQKIQLLPDEPRMDIYVPPAWDPEKHVMYWTLHNKTNRSALVKFEPKNTTTSFGRVLVRKVYDTQYGKFVVPMNVSTSMFYSYTRLGLMVTDSNVALVFLEMTDKRDDLKIARFTKIGFQAAQPANVVKYIEKEHRRPFEYMVTPGKHGKLYFHDMQNLGYKKSLDIPGAQMNPVATPLIPIQVLGRTEPLYFFGVSGINRMYVADFLRPNDQLKITPQTGVRIRGELLPYVYRDENHIFLCTTKYIYGIKVAGTGTILPTYEINMSGKVVAGAPTVHRDTLYVGTLDGWVMAYNLRGKGEFRWKTPIHNRSAVLGQPVVLERNVYFLTEDGYIYAYRTSH